MLLLFLLACLCSCCRLGARCRLIRQCVLAFVVLQDSLFPLVGFEHLGEVVLSCFFSHSIGPDLLGTHRPLRVLIYSEVDLFLPCCIPLVLFVGAASDQTRHFVKVSRSSTLALRCSSASMSVTSLCLNLRGRSHLIPRRWISSLVDLNCRCLV